LKKDGAKDVVVELMSVQHKSGSIIFKVEVLEGNVTGSFETSALFIDFRLGIGKDFCQQQQY